MELLTREHGEREDLGLGDVHERAGLGVAAREVVADLVPLPGRGGQVGLAKIVLNTAATWPACWSEMSRLHTAQAALAQAGQERPPEDFVLAVTDVQA